MKRRVEVISDDNNLQLDSVKKCKANRNAKVSFPVRPPANPLFSLLLPQFYSPPTTWTAGQAVINRASSLLMKNRHLLNARDGSDIFGQGNTAAHYLVFFLGSYGGLPTATDSSSSTAATFRTFVALLRLITLRFHCNLLMANSKGTTALSFAFRWNTVSRRVMFSICRERVNAEKRAALDILNRADPLLTRCGVVRDIQRDIKLRVLTDRLCDTHNNANGTFGDSNNLFKRIALAEIQRRQPFSVSELASQLTSHLLPSSKPVPHKSG